MDADDLDDDEEEGEDELHDACDDVPNAGAGDSEEDAEGEDEEDDARVP